MRPGVAVASLALLFALPAIAQLANPQHRSAEHTGVSQHFPYPSHSGYEGQTGLRTPSSFLPPGGLAGLPSLPSPARAGTGFGNGLGAAHSRFIAPDLRGLPPYQPGFGDNPDHRNRYHNRDHRRGDYHRHAGGYGYPNDVWAYPYPYVSSFTLSGWDDDQSTPDQNMPAPDYAEAPTYPEAAPQYDQARPGAMPYRARPPYQPPVAAVPEATITPASSVLSRDPLTVIFKDGRPPEKMQNYMMNGTTLTNLDPQHFEEIPLDQVDVAATAKLNRAHGITFQVPGAPGE